MNMKSASLAAILLGSSLAYGGQLTERIAKRHAVKSTDVWYGGRRTVFDFEGYDAWVVEPPEGVRHEQGMPWTWTMQWREAFVPRTGVPQLLKKGWHHVSVDTFKDKMDANGLKVSERFQRFLVDELGFAPKAHLVGMSWGGFFSIRYAAHHPENVAKIYLDCPLLNLGGRCGRPADEASIGPWAKNPPENWIDDPRMPVNMAPAVAAAKIPILLVYGGADNVLEPSLNSEIFIPRFKAAGGEIEVIYRSLFGHHPHGFEENDATVVDFFGGSFAKDR